MSESSRFLSLLFPTVDPPAQVAIWDKKTGSSAYFKTDSPSWKEDLEATAQALNTKGHDVYLRTTLLDHGFSGTGRGKKGDVVGSPGFWVDLDLLHPQAHAASNLPKDLSEACEVLAAVPFEPTMVVESGYGLHVWWLFDTPLRFTNEEERKTAELATKGFQSQLIRRAAQKGWQVDKTGDFSRVLRLPGMHNHKLPAPRPVTILDANGPRHDTLTLIQHGLTQSGYAPTQIGQSPIVKASATPTHTGSRTPAAPPAVSGGVGGGTVDYRAILQERRKYLKNQDSRELMKQILDGVPFAKPGERDNMLQRVASVLVFTFRGEAPAAPLAELCRASLDAMRAQSPPGDPGPDVVDAEAKIARALEDFQEKKALQEAADREIRDALSEAVRSSNPDPTLGPSDTANTGAYTDVDIGRYAAQQGCTLEEFEKRWIIQKGPSYYVYCNGRYLQAITRDELDVSLRRDLAPAPIIWDAFNKDGSLRDKKVPELLRDYSTVARKLNGNLAIKVSYYDAKDQTFHEAVCPLRDLSPLCVAEIDQWLRLLGGNDPDLLLDWIATVTNLERYSSALYLSGHPGTGKTLLAQGLARLWTTGSPTELGRILDNWNSDLEKCPLILADEQIPQTFKGQRTTAVLRALIGSTCRTLTRKYQANADLHGAIRLILCANHDHLLEMGDEDLGANDLEAVAGRFLHVVTPQSAKDYLLSIGGPKKIQAWVDGDLIARHALWLRDNRQVSSNGRFLVEGKATEMHRLLATQGFVPSGVCEVLARYLDKPKQFQSSPHKALIRCGNGKLLVNTNAIAALWELYHPDKLKVPSTTKIGKALGNLSTGEQRVNNYRYHEVNSDLVVGWAIKNQIGDAAAMMEQVNRALVEEPSVLTSTLIPPKKLDV